MFAGVMTALIVWIFGTPHTPPRVPPRVRGREVFIPRPKDDEQEERPHYYLCEFSEAELRALRQAMGKIPVKTKADKDAIEALDLAERVELPRERIQWAHIDAWYGAGYSLGDMAADGFRPKPLPEDERDGKGSE